MARSAKKGPWVDLSLMKKINRAKSDTKKVTIKTSPHKSVNKLKQNKNLLYIRLGSLLVITSYI